MATKKDMALLALIVSAMANEAAPYHLATEAELKKLASEGLVETNAEIRDGDKIAVRATEAGIAAHTAANPNNEGNTNMAETGNTSAPAASSFDLIDGAVLPAGRGGRNANVYPFDTMNAGQSFFVPATEAKPNPAKSIASTVSSATKRYTGVEGQADRKFSVKSVKSGGVYGSFTAPADGALVQRTA